MHRNTQIDIVAQTSQGIYTVNEGLILQGMIGERCWWTEATVSRKERGSIPTETFCRLVGAQQNPTVEQLKTVWSSLNTQLEALLIIHVQPLMHSVKSKFDFSCRNFCSKYSQYCWSTLYFSQCRFSSKGVRVRIARLEFLNLLS